MKVRCINPGICGPTYNRIYKVTENLKSHKLYKIMDDDSVIRYYNHKRFEIVENDKGENEMDDKKREFNFVLPSINAYLRNEWKRDLTRKNPLIVARVGSHTDFMIHESILEKARQRGFTLPIIDDTDKDIARLTEWVKMVKSCEWYDEKVSVKVVIPKI